MTPEILGINVSCDEIFDFAIGRSCYHPIERHIDPTLYDVLTDSIYNKRTKEYCPQPSNYKKFYEEVALLVSKAKNMSGSELLQVSEEVSEISPKELYL